MNRAKAWWYDGPAPQAGYPTTYIYIVQDFPIRAHVLLNSTKTIISTRASPAYTLADVLPDTFQPLL